MDYTKELHRTRNIPLTVVEHADSRIILLRADLWEAGVKTTIGQCLVAHEIETGRITNSTRALVVHGAGNTVTSVQIAAEEQGLDVEVIAVVYAETSRSIRERLQRRGIRMVAEAQRAQGREGRMTTAEELCQREKGYVMIEQHEQPLIIDIQRETLGQRIAEEVPEATHFIAGVGTGGTVFGIGSALRNVAPQVRVVALEGVGSTLSLWHAYCGAQHLAFKEQEQAIAAALRTYAAAGMLTKLTADSSRPPDQWFEIDIHFPPHVRGTVGIEGLGVGGPTQLILDNITSLDEVRIVTDVQARDGVDALAEHEIYSVESAGANFFTALGIANELQARGKKPGTIISVVTAKK